MKSQALAARQMLRASKETMTKRANGLGLSALLVGVLMCFLLGLSIAQGGAWRTQGRTLQSLISGLKRYKIITSPDVERAMLKIDRADFCKGADFAYHDSPQHIGAGQTISAPHIHAAALETLKDFIVRPKARVMDVGSGSGYLTACMAEMMNPALEGRVYGLELVNELFEQSIVNIKKRNAALLESGRISMFQGDGWSGLPQFAPFDAIHVGASAEEVPEALISQLKPGGRMIIPVGVSDQVLYQVDKLEDGSITKKKLADVMYVPLVRKNNCE